MQDGLLQGYITVLHRNEKFLSTVNLLILVYKIILVSFDLYYYINTARTATGYIGQFF